MHYLVTGGGGFIGSNIVAELLRRGEEVRVLDNFSTGRRINLAPFENQIELIEGDIRSYHIVREAAQGMDFILHQAALPSVPRSVLDPLTTNEVNVGGTLNILQAAKETRVKRVVYASSSSVYGDNPELPKVETMCPSPLSPYAVSKLAGEQYCRAFWRLYQLEVVSLRYFNVFGPRQDPTSQYAAVVPKFITALGDDEPLTVYGDGLQSRDFTFVQNVVQANLRACQAEGAPGQVFNVACGQRYTLLRLIEVLSDIFGKEARVVHAAARPGDVRHSQADISRARTVLGYQPEQDLTAALEQTVRGYLA